MHPCSTDASSSTTSETPKPSAPTSSTAAGSPSHPKTTRTPLPTSSKKHGSSAHDTDQATHPSAHTQPHAYPNASSTGNANAKTPATHPTPATPPSAETTPQYVVNWNTLTPTQATTILEIETRINWYGYSEREVANQLGTTTKHVREQRATLRSSLQRGGGSDTRELF
jgi:small-conductance mechanosensitive channel